MSMKRQATTDLNHENWDQDDPAEHEEMGSFKTASKDVIEKRVIRTAKRRSEISNEEGKKSVFSGFGGFNKTQPSSFEFLANLTNGNKNTNGSTKAETAVTSSLFTSKPISNSGGGIFGNTVSTTPPKSPFGSPNSQTTPSFDGPSGKTDAVPSIFTASKADSTVHDSPFKAQPVSSSVDTNFTDLTTSTNAPTPNISSTIFGVSSTSANVSKSLFSTTNSTPFKIQPVSSTTTSQSSLGITNVASKTNLPEKKNDEKPNDKKMQYYAKLKGLNESVSDWIKKHVEQTPLCILSPIFKDYEKYLKEIQDEHQSSDNVGVEEKNKESSTSEIKSDAGNISSAKTVSAFSNNNTGTSLFATVPSNPKASIFGTTTKDTATGEKTSSFSFGVNTSTSALSSTSPPSTGFSFGVTTTMSTFTSATATTTSSSNSGAPFSFGIGKPFSFNTNVQQNTETKKNEQDDEEEPPKVEFTPVVEDNSVYDKRCKVFVKKDGNFVEKGVGTLYVKKIEESGKHQLLVRANTNLGNVLVNLILVSAIPTQRMGKNNVMLVCIPTPDSKPPPTPILIRVKTAEEADELLETLNKYKT